MRSLERLDNFYNELKEIHKRSFPDMRFGQFMTNALGWVSSTKKRDPFFPEENEMLNLIKEYANSNSIVYDNFNGTGTTGVACIKLGLNYIGSELSEEQCRFSIERLNKVVEEIETANAV